MASASVTTREEKILRFLRLLDTTPIDCQPLHDELRWMRENQAFGITRPRVIYARPDYTKMRPSTGNAVRDKLVAAKLQVRATRSE